MVADRRRPQRRPAGPPELHRGSRAEIGITKHAYVQGRSGWFSDRSAVYLASGKPVLAEATGLERCLPTGRGLLTFADVEEAAAGVAAINRDYAIHCRAARALAEEYLDHRKVPPAMLRAFRRRPGGGRQGDDHSHRRDAGHLRWSSPARPGFGSNTCWACAGSADSFWVDRLGPVDPAAPPQPGLPGGG
jgi:hypothetical protein